MTSAPRRKKSASEPQPTGVQRIAANEIVSVVLILGIALLLIVQSGSRRAVELMPWPDGLEYAAMAVNLSQGRGPVLHFGGYSYASRYTEGYPLILAQFLPLLRNRIEALGVVSALLGLLALLGLYVLTRRHFGRTSASVAALLLGCSPVFIAYSSLVLSDIAALCVCIFAALMVSHASRAELAYAKASASGQKPVISGAIHWMLFAAMAGFAVMIRPTNAAIIAGLAAALSFVRPKFDLVDLTLGNIAAGIASCAILFATPVLWQLHENSVHLGSAWASGYAFWVPEVYGSFAETFNARFLFGETLPRNPHGNLPVYFLALSGLDRLIADAAAPPFYLYPFSAAVFAAVGLKRAVRLDEATQRVIYLGLGFLAALLSIYLFYHFTDIVFLLPGIFVVFALAGFGTMEANRILRREWSKTKPSGRGYVLILAIALLDLGLIGSITSELIHRLSLRPPASNVVPALQAIDRQIEPDAVVVSNVSLQFLELYLQPLARKFEGLHSFDPGEDYTDYHLGRLYAKRAAGWQGPVPPVLFESGGIDRASTTELIAVSAKRQVYLLLAAPQSEEYGHILSSELKELSEKFEIEPVASAEPIELYRLKPH